MFCSACGTENSPESAYCSNCGVKLAPSSGAAPPAARHSNRANLVAGIVVLALLLAVGAGYAWKRAFRGSAGGDEASVKVTVDGKTFEVSSRDSRVEARGLADEFSSDTVRGQVLDTGWRKYVVRSSDTGKTYVFHVGRTTSYNTRRKPGVGSRISVTWHRQRGRLVADRVTVE